MSIEGRFQVQPPDYLANVLAERINAALDVVLTDLRQVCGPEMSDQACYRFAVTTMTAQGLQKAELDPLVYQSYCLVLSYFQTKHNAKAN